MSRKRDSKIPKLPTQTNGPAVQQQSGSVLVSAEYQGPLPLPAMLEEYNHIHPGLAQTIVSQFENEGNHRRSMEQGILRLASRGQLYGFLLGIVGFAGAFLCIVFDRDIEGLAVFLATLGSLVGTMVYKTKTAAKQKTT